MDDKKVRWINNQLASREEEHWCQMMDQKDEDHSDALVKFRNVLEVVYHFVVLTSHFGLSLIHRTRKTKIWLALHMSEKLVIHKTLVTKVSLWLPTSRP
ncbi:unnamed protein product [Brassica oleracea var. botrytis]|uniref:Uncharacterized protein n=1 Tax=Brassica oleracea var. oleracea TaxID=109376 RepID=A0A0D3D1D4_BRAOL